MVNENDKIIPGCTKKECFGELYDMRLQKQVYENYKDHIKSHMEENRKGGMATKTALEYSPLNCNGILDKTVHIPKVYDEKTIEHFKQITCITHQIFSKVIKEYLEHEDYRHLFPFPKELEELILLPASYEGLLPIMRMDIFYNEDTGAFQFCEINTDGTAAMIRDYEMRKALVHNPAHQSVIRQFDLRPFELFDTWVSTFLSLYNNYHKKKANPNVALIDYLEDATQREFEEFVRRFQDVGINCEICDIRSLHYKDGSLYSPTGNRIDAIYRRAVTADIMAHYEESSDLLDAIRDDAVFIAGAFATQIIHSKWLFYVLHHTRTKAFLTEEEHSFIKKHVPLTVAFSKDHISLREVLEHKDQYIIKPMDAYASKGIYAAGREYDEQQWEKIVRDLYGKGFICQEYCQQYMTDNIDFAWGDGKWPISTCRDCILITESLQAS